MLRDKIFARMCMLCTLAGLPPTAWLDMDLREFEAAVRRRVAQ